MSDLYQTLRPIQHFSEGFQDENLNFRVFPLEAFMRLLSLYGPWPYGTIFLFQEILEN